MGTWLTGRQPGQRDPFAGPTAVCTCSRTGGVPRDSRGRGGRGHRARRPRPALRPARADRQRLRALRPRRGHHGRHGRPRRRLTGPRRGPARRARAGAWLARGAAARLERRSARGGSRPDRPGRRARPDARGSRPPVRVGHRLRVPARGRAAADAPPHRGPEGAAHGRGGPPAGPRQRSGPAHDGVRRVSRGPSADRPRRAGPDRGGGGPGCGPRRVATLPRHRRARTRRTAPVPVRTTGRCGPAVACPTAAQRRASARCPVAPPRR